MNLKQTAGERAAEFVENGMTIGLGTGSTVYWTIRQIGLQIEKGLQIRAVPTSEATARLAAELNIPLIDFASTAKLDLTIDGADEINPAFDLIKGGGGALLREKLVAAASKKLIIVADESKLVADLGAFPLPIEVVKFAWETTARRLEEIGLKSVLRKKENEVFVTDNGNYILDCGGGKIVEPATLHQQIKLLTGVVETGIFPAMADMLIIASENGVRIMEKSGAEKIRGENK